MRSIIALLLLTTQGLNGCCEFHPVVSGYGITAPHNLLFPGWLMDEDGSVSARTGVAEAGSVKGNGDGTLWGDRARVFGVHAGWSLDGFSGPWM